MADVLEELRRLGGSNLGRPAKARQAADLIRAARSYHWVGLYDVTPADPRVVTGAACCLLLVALAAAAAPAWRAARVDPLVALRHD